MKIYCEADRIESDRRMREIDTLRANGGKTEYELLLKNIRLEQSSRSRLAREVIVKNTKTREVTKHNSIKEACKVYDAPYHIILANIKNNRVLFKDLLFTSMDHVGNESIVEVKDKVLINYWSKEDEDYLMRARENGVSWKIISEVLDKTISACISKYKKIKRRLEK